MSKEELDNKYSKGENQGFYGLIGIAFVVAVVICILKLLF